MQEILFYPIFILILLAFSRKIKLPAIFNEHSDTAFGMAEFAMVHSILQKKIPYYQKLSAAGKRKFFSRLKAFNQSKEYIGMDGLTVTEEMKAVIAAPAIQLTFGLKNFTLETIDKIEVYPETFYSRFHTDKLKGITTGTGILAVSWKDIQEGYQVYDDKLNLGLHEMAHALKLTVVREYDFDPDFASYLENWLKIGMYEFLQMKNDDSSFMRSYGGTNTQEFFAVSVEHFFEAPADFKAKLPDIYNHLCILLNQDPLNENGDYTLRPGFVKEINLDKTLFPVPEKILPNYRYSKWHWTLTLLIFGMVSIVALPFAAYGTSMEGNDILRIAIGIIITAAITYYEPILRKEVMNYFQYLWYLGLIVLPLGFVLFLSLNRMIILSVTREEFPILYPHAKTLWINTHPEDDTISMRIKRGQTPVELFSKDYVWVTYKKEGLFGYTVNSGPVTEAKRKE